MQNSLLKKPSVWTVFLTSFGLRVLAWFWVITHETQLYCDERGYFNRAIAWHSCLNSLIHGTLPDANVSDTLYGYGVWPPLHSLLLSLGGMVAEINGVRFIPVLFSALTTLLIIKLAQKCGFSFKTALFAGFLHALYPEYIAFSHYLWSETTFTFFLLAGMVSALSSSDAPEGSRQRAAYALLAGFLFGLGTLCRVTVLPVLALFAGWWGITALFKFIKTRASKPFINEIFRTALLCLIFLTIITPWMLVLKAREGKWVPLSTSGGYNFYLGNHPATPDGLGSAWGMFIYYGGAGQQIDNYVREHSAPAEVNPSPIWVFSRNDICRQGANEVIRKDPASAVKRVFLRLGTLFAPDIFLTRHIINLVYHPMSNLVASALIILATLFWIFVLTGTASSLLSAQKPARYWILIAAAILLIIPALITISLSRMRFASTLLILPVCAHGLSGLRHYREFFASKTRVIGAALLLIASLGVSLHFYRLTMLNFTIPSAQYTPIIKFFSRIGFMQPYTFDTFSLTRDASGPNRVALKLPRHPENSLNDRPELSEMLIPLPSPNQIKPMIISSKLGEPVELLWSHPQLSEVPPMIIEPGNLSKEWMPTGIPGLFLKTDGANYRKGIWKGPKTGD